MALTLPDGKSQFLDANGNPLAAGYVYHYIPSTSTPKDTYQDINATILNTNPVVLDAAGRAVIFGTGAYRQVVTDSLGNQQWDQVTQVATLALLGAVALAGDTMTGRLTVPGVTINGSAGATITPIGNPSLLSVNPISGTTASTTQHELLLSANYVSNKGQGASVPLSKNKVALYVGMQADPGSGNTWAFNPLLLLTAGACTLGGSQIIEADLANHSGTHFGDTAGFAGVLQPAVFGMQITGISTNRATAALAVLGNLSDLVSPMWNRGLVFANNSVKQVAIADYTTSDTSIDIRGSHANYGVDFNNGVCTGGVIRLGNQQKIVGRNAANAADYTLVQTSVGDNLALASASNPYVLISAGTGLAPIADNTLLCGQSGARWSQVWAGNGAIQTSDPTLKTDIQTLDDVDVEGIIEAIAPITFRFVDGGGGKPGVRTHWGFNAEDLEGIEALSGRDYAGFVRAEDGILGRRADQENAILWEAVRRLQRRVAALEGVV